MRMIQDNQEDWKRLQLEMKLSDDCCGFYLATWQTILYGFTWHELKKPYYLVQREAEVQWNGTAQGLSN